MTDEMDIDRFLFGRPIVLDDDDVPVGAIERLPTPAGLQDAPDPTALIRERVMARQTTLEGGEEPVAKPPAPASAYVMAMILRSRTGSDRPHIVTILTFPEGSQGPAHREVVCTCEAMLSVARRPDGCWAMTWVRGIVGIPPPGGPA